MYLVFTLRAPQREPGMLWKVFRMAQYNWNAHDAEVVYYDILSDSANLVA